MYQYVSAALLLLLGSSSCFPSSDTRDSQDYGVDNAHLGELARAPGVGVNGSECDQCDPQLCAPAVGCRAGLVPDRCGCCAECANLEGQPCDLDNTGTFYGRCGTELSCQLDLSDLRHGEVLEPQCVCTQAGPVCGSDGNTYLTMCQFREAAFSNSGLGVQGSGACATVPIIKVPPRNLVNVTGSSVVFLCEVFAFPMALIEWRKDGDDTILPGDDPHISVQSRGGPMKYELSSWLQIENMSPGDAGTYRCVAHNSLGSISASAVLGVLRPDEASTFTLEDMPRMFGYDPQKEYDEDYY